MERDESMAAWWVSQAAEQGDAGAQSHLGSRYVHGVGVEKSDFDAFFWLDLAAKGGNEEAIAARTRMTLQIAPVRTGTTRKRLRIAQLEAKNGC